MAQLRWATILRITYERATFNTHPNVLGVQCKRLLPVTHDKAARVIFEMQHSALEISDHGIGSRTIDQSIRNFSSSVC